MSPRAFCRRVTSLGTVALSLSVSHRCVASVCQRGGVLPGRPPFICCLTVDRSPTSTSPPPPPLTYLSLSLSLCRGAVCLVSLPPPPPLLSSTLTPISSDHPLCHSNLTLPPPPYQMAPNRRPWGAGGARSSASVSCGFFIVDVPSTKVSLSPIGALVSSYRFCVSQASH